MFRREHGIQPFQSVLSHRAAATACLLFAVAVLIRFYRLDTNLLWLDELYGYQLTQLGPRIILLASRLDEHPPLYNLLQWVTSGFGLWQTAWALRWPAALAGAATIPLFYLLATKVATQPSAFVAAFIMAISSGHIFYSQEARPYTISILLATLSAWLLTRIHGHPTGRLMRWWYTIILIAGCWNDYAFAVIAAIQLLWFVLNSPQRSRAATQAAIVGLCCLPLIALAINPLGNAIARYASNAILKPSDMVTLLLAPNTRHDTLLWFPALLTIVAGVGVWRAVRCGWAAYETYFVLQLLLPLVLFFAIAQPLLHIQLPNWEARQFLVLMPSFFFLVALGVDWVSTRLPWRLAIIPLVALCLCAVFISSIDLQFYWNKQKSPEGVAALVIRDGLHSDDAVVSLNSATNAAVGFYLPSAVPYTYPKKKVEGYVFSRSTSVIAGGPYTSDTLAPFSEIELHRRIWLLWSEVSGRTATGDGVRRALTSSCQTELQRSFGEFRLLLLDKCRSEGMAAPSG